LLISQIRIRVGEYDFASVLEPYPYTERSVRRKVVHPQYNFFTYENDLALVQLDEPLVFQPHIAPICLPEESVQLLGKNATVTGWGRLSEGQTSLFDSFFAKTIAKLQINSNRFVGKQAASYLRYCKRLKFRSSAMTNAKTCS
jgi:hypothetical protein